MLDRKVGPVTLVNTGVMGPGYQSAYGLVMGIHVDPKRGGFDNQIRTHGSVDYTSIARRFSHGCHRLVNNRAVRLFDFVLRHRTFERVGNVPHEPQEALRGRRRGLQIRDQDARLLLRAGDRRCRSTCWRGKVMGDVKKPITAYVRKPGVEYTRRPGGRRRGATSTAITTPAP